MRHVVLVLALLTAAPAAAQVISRPTDPPLVTAERESWFRLREPIQFAGDLSYPAGAAVFFDGQTMVRSGHYNGVPLYTDTTLEPYSIVFVPMRPGLMQPYERLRRGDLAGTTGSRAPSFPVQIVPDRPTEPMAPVAPTDLPLPPGAISVFTPEPPAVVVEQLVPSTAPAEPLPLPSPDQPLRTAITPTSNDGIWIEFRDERWISAGPAVPFQPAAFARTGEYAGFAVFTRAGEPDTIYLPTRDDLVAPYRRR